jgi:large subunit ribosomal protein L34
MAKTQGPTYNPSKIKRIRKFGFRARNSSKGGKLVIKRQRLKGRHAISVSSEFGTTKIEKNKRFGRRR